MEENKPKRRKRYSGKYPKTFEEKYKEQCLLGGQKRLGNKELSSL